jgi:Protein of unknown function (DUF3108)
MMSRLSARCWFALLGGLVAGFDGTPAAAQADLIRARYSVTLVGLHIGDASASGLLQQDGYKIDLNAQLSGLAAMVSHLQMALASSGSIRKGTVVPAAYATTSANAYETRTVRMSLHSGNVTAVDISPPFEDREGRVPVTEALKRNILDPTSALIMAVPPGQSLVGPTACNRTIPVYDGFTRFDITLSYVGTRTVSVPGYAGPVSVCAARYTPLAGHKLDSKSTQFMAANREIEAWLAPVEHAHVVVPFRVSMRTMAGMAVVDAVEFNIAPSDMTATTH